MKSFWISWYSPKDIGAFELHSPWWVSGCRVSDSSITICAAIRADNENSAKAFIYNCYDKKLKEIEFRFCDEFQGSPFSDKFQQQQWMQWEETECNEK
jgi:hypothetical protein